MKIALLTSHLAAMPVIGFLHQQQLITAIAVQDDFAAVNTMLGPYLSGLQIGYTVVEKKNRIPQLEQWLLQYQPDLVLVLGCSYILPEKLFQKVPYGFFNIHFSLLPAYQGPSPVFWQLKNREKLSGVSIHRMTSTPDGGDVLVQIPYAITEADTLGSLNVRLAELTVPALMQFIQLRLFASTQASLRQDNINASYHKRPEAKDLRIDWQKMDAATIKALVQAANPAYGGATAICNGMEIKVLQVSLVQGGHHHWDDPVEPGQLVADASSDPIVACAGNTFLKIEALVTTNGMMTGNTWKKHFVQEALDSPIFLS